MRNFKIWNIGWSITLGKARQAGCHKESEEAFKRLKFIDYEIIENSLYYEKYRDNDRQARNMFNDLLSRSRYLRNGKTIVDFI